MVGPASGSRDPYELDRLANELAVRELSNGDAQGVEHELPLLVPLSHDHPLLSSETETFNVDAFLLSRPNTSLADLRGELRDYLALLKEELVQLINDDYAAFISLRTDLRGEGPRLERLLEPLQTVKADIDKSRLELDGIQTAIQLKLSERSALREEKTLLHLLLKVSDLVARLENMLLIPSPDDSTSQSLEHSNLGVRDMNGMITHEGGFHHQNGDEDADEQRPAVNRAKHLSRIAVEYNQLLYHADKARKQDCVFVDQLQKRMERIQVTLSRDLDVVFSAALLSVTSSVPVEQQSTAARARAISELSECLHIYEMLERWDAAGDVIRQDIVVPFVKKAIHPAALSGPLSPMVPRTPHLDVPSTPSTSQNGLLSPNTPFTPYPTSFQALASLAPSQDQGHSISLIEGDGNPDDPLVHLLNTILRFVERDCKLVIDLAERANSARSYKRYKGRIAANLGEPEDSVDAARQSFDIIGGVVWAEVGRALMEDLGTSLFAAGRPDEFQKNYTVLHEFITALEYAAPSSDAVSALRRNRVYEAFERRWQLPVYFQLRWKEIVGGLEDSLVRPSPELTAKKSDGFFAPQARGIHLAIATCWSSTVFIPELGHRFWKLTLQILSRYQTWLDSTLPVRRNLSSSTSEKPEPQEDIDDAHLKAFSSALADIRNLQRKTRSLFSDTIASLLPMESILSEDVLPAEAVLSETLARLDVQVPALSSQVVSILTARCCEPLQHVRSIPSQYRAMSARKGPDMPTESSYFVPNVLRPLREFLLDADGPGVALQREFGAAWASEVFKAVVTKYTAYLSGMKKTEDSLRRYNKSKRSTFMLFGANNANGAAGGDKEGRDEIRIRAQMVLDVETLGKNARSLGAMIDVDGSEEYAELKALAAHTDSQG